MVFLLLVDEHLDHLQRSVIRYTACIQNSFLFNNTASTLQKCFIRLETFFSSAALMPDTMMCDRLYGQEVFMQLIFIHD